MSLLKKIFGKKPEAETHKARAVRVSLSPLHRIHFVPQGFLAQFEPLNISVSGMALLHKGQIPAKPGDELGGKLTVDQEIFPLRMQVRHMTENLAGCQFVSIDPALTRAIEKYLRGEILAMKLRRVADIYVKPDSRGQVLWFTDGRQNEIYCVYDGKGIVSFHMSFLGHYLEGDLVRGVRVGSEKEIEQINPGHRGALLLNMEKSAPEQVTNLAKSIIQHVDLSDDYKAQILKIFDLPK